MSRVAHRILPLVVALGLAACSNPVAPTVPTNRTLQPGSASHEEETIYYAPDGTYCRSGYNVANGRCN